MRTRHPIPARRPSALVGAAMVLCFVAIAAVATLTAIQRGQELLWSSAPPTMAPAAVPIPTISPAQRVIIQSQAPHAPRSDPTPALLIAVDVAPAPPAPPAPPLVLPTAPPEIIQSYQDRTQDACHMPRADPATCGVSGGPLPWPNGREK